MGRDSLFHQALLFEKEERYGEALPLFEQCASDPTLDEGDIWFHSAWCRENCGEKHGALSLYAKAAETTHIPSCKLNSYFRSGWILVHMKENLKAADMFRYAIDYGDLVSLRDETYRHAMYWYAVCVESQSMYLDALTWYRQAQAASAQLDPESRYRQIICLTHVGLYNDALDVCLTFDAPVPEEFDPQRYESLRAEVKKERAMLEASLAPSPRHHLSIGSYAFS